jgi:hypothetical protein
MRTISTSAAVASVCVLFAACGPKQDASQQQAAQAPAAYPQQQPGGYPQQQPGAYPQQQPGAYPQQQPGAYPQQAAPPPTYAAPAPAPPAPGPAAPAPAPASGQMAVPGPVAFQCTNDVPCGTHHCNTQYGKCAFPCQTNTDCITPNACVLGLCVPQMPQAAPAGH